MNHVRPEIYTYHDYRKFLTDWLAYKKASQSDFSLRHLAKKAAVASGYLPMILNGKRPLTAAAWNKILPHLGLNAREKTFFDLLLVLGTSDSHEARLSALDRMKRFQQYQKNNPRETEVYDYLTHWYYVAIREMASLPDFNEDPEWIQSRLRYTVPLKDVKDAIAFLLSNGYWERTTDGRIQPPDKPLDCSGGVYRIALAKFHHEIFDLAVQSMERAPSSERQILGHTLSIGPEDYDKACEIVNEALAKIRELGENSQKVDAVYHLELALFPLTQKLRSPK